jgi:hypothetical protein
MAWKSDYLWFFFGLLVISPSLTVIIGASRRDYQNSSSIIIQGTTHSIQHSSVLDTLSYFSIPFP